METDALWAALTLLRNDLEELKQAVGINGILNDDEVRYWKAHTHAVEVLVTELRTYKGDLPGNLKDLAQQVADVKAPACRADDHVVQLRRPA